MVRSDWTAYLLWSQKKSNLTSNKVSSMMQHRTCDWVQTYTEIQFWLLDPYISEIHIKDIAHSLSLQCRFNGHCTKFYSVAENSVHAASLLPYNLKLSGLPHDISEAYLADPPRPLKYCFPEYSVLEKNLQKLISTKYSLAYLMHSEVSKVDQVLLATEKESLMAHEPAPWHQMPEPADCTLIKCWDLKHAEAEFLSTFNSLTK